MAAITTHNSCLPHTDELSVHRDVTGSASSGATASGPTEPLTCEHVFITERRDPCHGIIHYLYEGSSSPNNTQA